MEQRLTEKQHWNGKYQDLQQTTQSQNPVRSPWKRMLHGLFGRRLREYSRPYHQYLYFQVVLDRYLPREPGLKMIEMGSAPGRLLVQFSSMFGYEPYGVDYSDDGVAINRQVFAEAGIDPDHVLQRDFLSTDFSDEFRDQFDVVWSHSLIEHFADPKDLVDKHLAILKPGGYLVVFIPNLRGLNGKIFNFFDSNYRKVHNLDLMNKEAFSACFDPEITETLYNEYTGTFHFGLFNTPAGSRKRPVLRLCQHLQRMLSISFRLLFRDRGCEHAWHSPGLIFVGRKR